MPFGKYIMLVLIISMSFNVMLWGGSKLDQFTQGNEAYEAGKYNEAIEIYTTLIDEGLVSEVLFLNLGNAHFKKGELPLARLFFEKGLKENASHRALKNNLALVIDKIDSDIGVIDDIFFISWWRKWIGLLSATTWFLLFIIFSLVVATLLWIKLFNVSAAKILKPKWLFYLITLFAIVLLLSSIGRHHMEVHVKQCIVTESLFLKSGPDDRSENVRDINAGEKVRVIDSIGDWQKVVLRNKSTGWISGDSLLEI